MVTSAHENIAPGFAAPDRTDDPSFYVRFLKATDALEDVQSIRQSMRRSMRLRPGVSVLDVGCGIGTEARTLAALVGETGRVVGMDTSDVMIATARQLAESDAAKPPQLVVGDAHQLAFDDNTFHSCRAERVFVYVRDPR